MGKEIEDFWFNFASQNNLALTLPDYWMFGDGSKEMGDELAALVLAGKKTGTCSLKMTDDLENEPIPKVGQYDIILNGDEASIAIIRYTVIEEIPMNQVTENFAISEGEGDLTYEYWYRNHQSFFTHILNDYGLDFSPDITVICQTFEVCDRK